MQTEKASITTMVLHVLDMSTDIDLKFLRVNESLNLKCFEPLLYYNKNQYNVNISFVYVGWGGEVR